MIRFVLAATLALAGADIAAAVAAQAAHSVREGVYTEDQASHGKAMYGEKCASCHGSLESSMPDMAPLLNDRGFQNIWRQRTVGDLFVRIRETMPQNQRGTLSPEESADLVAYILSANLLPAGATPLSPDADALKQIRLDIEEP